MAMNVPNPTSTSWIPIQGDPRERVTYWGTYEASRIYKDGDCVIGADKVLYVCTKNGTTSAPPVWPKRSGGQGVQGPQGPQGSGMPIPVTEGQWLKGIGGVAVWSPLTVADIPNALDMPTYGIDLPHPPVDGQEHILVDNYSSPTWSWRCHYNASSTSSYKWDVAGVPLFAYVNGQMSLPGAGGWYELNSTRIRVPRSGIYICKCSCRTLNNGGNGSYNHLQLFLNTPGNVFGPQPVFSTANGAWGNLCAAKFSATFSRGDMIGIGGYGTANPAYYDMVVWSIEPVRIS
jgi:hypothetical protein